MPFSISPSSLPSALSRSSRSQMEPLLSLNNSVPLEFSGHYNNSSAGTTMQTTSQQHYNITCKKKSSVRLNDQLIPKPTDINIGERKLSNTTPKEHPYSSHIPRFAMFPSFCSSDDSHAGVRAASQLNPLIPNSPLDATVLSKAIGGPYRHEILETPMKTRNKTVMWPGEHGFLDYTKPLKEKKQVFYPAPPKTVLPNSTSNMLKNLEQALWVTSYQLHYTGSGPVNPLKTDDFKEKMSGLAGRNTYSSPLTERSYPLFVPSKPNHECRRRQDNCSGWSTSMSTAAELLNPSPASIHQHRPQEITAKHNEGPHLNPKGHSQSGTTEAVSEEVSHEILNEQQNEHNSSMCRSGERERYKVQFDKGLMQVSESQSRRGANTQQPREPFNSQDPQGETDINREQSFREFESSHGQSAVAEDTAGIDLPTKLLSRADSEQEKPAENREMSCSLLLRPQVLPGIHPVDRAGTLGREGAGPRLLDLQSAFSRSEAHRYFNSSVTHAAVNLRDNVVTGKRHNFYGVNSYYLRG